MTIDDARVTDHFDPSEALGLSEHLAVDKVALLQQLQGVAGRSSFYREKWSAAELALVESATERDIEDVLSELPLTSKDELRRSQEALPPFGTYLSCDPSEVALVHRTSGTTGRALVIASTQADIDTTSRHGAQAFWAAGLRDDDVVVHCLNYCMWAGGFTDHRCLEATGAAVVPFGVGNSTELRTLQEWLPFSALSCTPSYVSLLIDQMTPEQRELWAKHLRLVLVGGEPGGSESALRETVSRAFGAMVVNANYGLAEVLSNFGSECEYGGGMHFHGHGGIWVELLDSVSGVAQPLEAGTRGDLVLTHLRKQAQPLVRYATNDVMEIVSTDQCECGRSTFRFRLHGRADDMFVVRGINVFPAAVQSALGEYSAALSEFAIVLPNTPTFDAVPLVLEVDQHDAAFDMEALASHLRTQLRCSVAITPVPPGTLPRTTGKSQRVYRGGDSPF